MNNQILQAMAESKRTVARLLTETSEDEPPALPPKTPALLNLKDLEKSVRSERSHRISNFTAPD